ncbi:MAG: Rieske (2Fe-2S) protein [Thermoproteota archaeon]|jgi:nitrite reductase/ring-hydroxylating ferredoxin subunit|nr:Rieske (2Fe-2S) protein [Thermoproteota archaeon]
MWIKLCKISDLKEDEIKGFDVNNLHLIAIKKGSEIHVLDGICTHEYYDLANAFILEDRIICPLHLSQFEISTGKVVNPPAEKSLKKYKTKIEEGFLFVEI